MNVPTHKAQHEWAGELPLVSEAARVTSVESMDDRRDADVRATLADLFDRHDADVPLDGDRIDRDRVDAVLADAGASPRARNRAAAVLERYGRAHPALLRVRFATADPLEYLAGQYVSIRYQGRTRPYSIASSPTEETTELCIRRVPEGRLSPTLCEHLAVGDEFTVRGPYGHLLLEEPSERDLVFLATGTGVAPFKSMIDYAFEAGYDAGRDVWLFLGAAWEDDLPFRREFRERARAEPNFHFVPTLSREPYLSEWPGETAYLQRTLLKYLADGAVGLGREAEAYLLADPNADVDARLDPARMEVYACGINAMVYSLVETVTKLGVPERHLHVEGYG